MNRSTRQAGQGGTLSQPDRRPVVALGECLIDMVAVDGASGGLAEASTFKRAAGGAPANVSVGVARLGAPAGFIGKVGSDPFGRFLTATLAAEGVDTSHLTETSGGVTAVAFVSLAQDGERHFHFYRHAAADLQLSASDIQADYVARAAVLHVGSLSLTAEPARSATFEALAVARSRGVPTSLDPNLRLDQWSSNSAARAAVLDLVSRVSVLKVSEDELEFLTGSSNLAAARSLMHDGTELVCVTVGEGGVWYATPTGTGRVPGLPVDVVDTTGAGDAFVAALLVAYRENPGLAANTAALETALRRANAFAALTVTRHGAIPAMPSKAALEQFLRSCA